MCRKLEDGGRRCNSDNAFGIHVRNLQAQKQYHAKQGNTDRVASITDEMEKLREKKAHLTADGGKIRAYSMELTENAQRVLNQLREDGYEPYVVGGSVRDALLGLDSKDVDIEVYKATPEEVVASLRKIGQVDEVGKSFGVLKIQIGGEDFDVSLPRKDSKVGDGHRGFTTELLPELSMYEATARRDFTINALMYDNQLGYIIDKHEGLEDLDKKQLRHISDAFDEDPLRVLRGVQMASRFDMELHPDTVVKAQTLQPQFQDLAKERVQTEFEKLYSKGKAPHKAFQLLKSTGWDANFSGLAEANDGKLGQNLQRTQALADDGTIPKSKYAYVLSANIASHLNDNDAKSFLSYTTIGDDAKNGAYNLSRLKLPENEEKATMRHWAKSLTRHNTIQDWVYLAKSRGETEKAERIQSTAQSLGLLDGPEPDLVKGEDLMALFPGRRPGPWMRVSLDEARAAQYADGFRTRESGLAWIKKNLV